MTEALEQRVDLMKREIDALQISLADKAKPWYQNTSTVLSMAALLFSFGTTYVSYRHTANQDIQSTRQELRGMLQRLAALPKENVELSRKYADDPASMNLVGGFINQENALLARQAAELAKQLPADLVSGAEYYAIAIALQNSYDLSAASQFLKLSVEAATDFNTGIAALRSTASLQFIQGQAEAGRVKYQESLNIFSKYPGYDAFTRASTNVWTELAWASSEASAGFPSQAHQHVESAKNLVVGLPRGAGTDMLDAQVSQADLRFASGQPISLPVAGSPLGVVPAASTK